MFGCQWVDIINSVHHRGGHRQNVVSQRIRHWIAFKIRLMGTNPIGFDTFLHFMVTVWKYGIGSNVSMLDNAHKIQKKKKQRIHKNAMNKLGFFFSAAILFCVPPLSVSQWNIQPLSSECIILCVICVLCNVGVTGFYYYHCYYYFVLHSFVLSYLIYSRCSKWVTHNKRKHLFSLILLFITGDAMCSTHILFMTVQIVLNQLWTLHSMDPFHFTVWLFVFSLSFHSISFHFVQLKSIFSFISGIFTYAMIMSTSYYYKRIQKAKFLDFPFLENHLAFAYNPICHTLDWMSLQIDIKHWAMSALSIKRWAFSIEYIIVGTFIGTHIALVNIFVAPKGNLNFKWKIPEYKWI